MNQKQTTYQQSKFDNRNRLTAFAILSVLILLVVIGATSCITRKRVDKICQTCPVQIVEKHDTVITKITEYIKTDPLLDSLLFISSWSPEKITDTIYIEDTHWKGLFYVSTGKLEAKINYLSDSLLMLKQSTTSDINNNTVKTVTKNVFVPQPIRDKWFKFYCRFTWISIAVVFFLLLVWIIYKYESIVTGWNVFKNRF